MPIPLVAGLGAPELAIVFALVMLFFGASKLPDLARNTGQALRILRTETKALASDDEALGRHATEQGAAATPVEPNGAKPGRTHDDDLRLTANPRGTVQMKGTKHG